MGAGWPPCWPATNGLLLRGYSMDRLMLILPKVVVLQPDTELPLHEVVSKGWTMPSSLRHVRSRREFAKMAHGHNRRWEVAEPGCAGVGDTANERGPALKPTTSAATITPTPRIMRVIIKVYSRASHQATTTHRPTAIKKSRLNRHREVRPRVGDHKGPQISVAPACGCRASSCGRRWRGAVAPSLVTRPAPARF